MRAPKLKGRESAVGRGKMVSPVVAQRGPENDAVLRAAGAQARDHPLPSGPLAGAGPAGRAAARIPASKARADSGRPAPGGKDKGPPVFAGQRAKAALHIRAQPARGDAGVEALDEKRAKHLELSGKQRWVFENAESRVTVWNWEPVGVFVVLFAKGTSGGRPLPNARASSASVLTLPPPRKPTLPC